jgi:ABC-2 type transport system ATP-binding protein
LKVVDLEEKKDELIKHLSKGMRKRLLFGQAWIANPRPPYQLSFI